jgi:hypothetical protein
LSHQEVKPIIVEIDRACLLAGGPNLPQKAFETLLCKIFQCKDIKPNITKAAYDQSIVKGALDTEKFFAWYVANMFTGVSTMLATTGQLQSDSLIFKLARHHNITPVEVDKVKQWFDKYDTDHSGEIDYEEFADMMRSILKVKDKEDLSSDRLLRFWKEIDTDGSNGVDFGEFLVWYLKYFHNDEQNGDDDLSSGALLSAFYNTYNPTLARQKLQNNTVDLSRHDSRHTAG